MPTYANRVAGFGTTIFSEINNLADQYKAVNLGQGRPDFDGPAEVIEAAVRALQSGKANQYPPGVGTPAFRKAVADHANRARRGLERPSMRMDQPQDPRLHELPILIEMRQGRFGIGVLRPQWHPVPSIRCVEIEPILEAPRVEKAGFDQRQAFRPLRARGLRRQLRGGDHSGAPVMKWRHAAKWLRI